MTALSMFLRQRSENGVFDLFYFGALLALLAAWTQWDSRYRKKWHDYRSRNWIRVEGRFDEGEVITMRKGRSEVISGYEVWLTYEYQVHGEHANLYRVSERPKDEADAALRALANEKVIVRVNPKNCRQSFVADGDVTIDRAI